MGLSQSVRTLPVRALRRLASLPAEAALQVINAAPFEERLSRHYDQIRDAYTDRIPILSTEDDLIVRALEEHGVFVTSLNALGLPGTAEMFEQAAALSEILHHRTKDTRRIRSATGDDLISHPKIFQWGMSKRLLAVIEAYMGLPPAYDGLCYFHSQPKRTGTDTRDWHLDREDRRVIKIGVYVTDVGKADGPLQFISRSASRQVEPVSYRYRPITHTELARRLGSHELHKFINTITGPSGTVILLDTAQHFHRGSPPTAQPRSAIYYSYFGCPPRHPFFCERSPLSRAQLLTLIKTAEPYQRNAVLWRENLSRGHKWFPRSLV